MSEQLPGATSFQADVPAQTITVAPAVDAPPTTTAEQDRQTAGERRAKLTLSPKTTEEEDRKTQGQRDINRLWEQTQREIALYVIGCSLLVSVLLGVLGKWLGSENLQLAANVFLFGVANLVTGFYFGRTNHQRTGGVGGDSAGTR